MKSPTLATRAEAVTGPMPHSCAYAVRDFTSSTGESDSSWSRIGVAFPHRDGMGFDVVLDAVPVDGRVVLRSNELSEAERQVRELLRAAEEGAD